MEFFADLHLHSKYSRACSKNLDLENLVYWGKFKGINLFGTGDFTHPAWLAELKEKLENNGQGFFKLKDKYRQASAATGLADGSVIKKAVLAKEVYFVLSCEISSIFSRQGKVKRIHYVVIFPDFASVEKFNQKFSLYAKLSSDGRPITGLDVKKALNLALEVNPDVIFIPAHCLLPDTLIHTKEKFLTSIHNIKEGELVYTHGGKWQKVKKVLSRPYKGKILHIQPYYFRLGLKVTPEHPFFAVKTHKNCHWSNGICKPIHENNPTCGKKYYKDYQPQWIPAAQLEKGDALIFPRFLEAYNNHAVVSIAELAKEEVRFESATQVWGSGTRSKKVFKEIPVTKEFCRLIGYFLAEGYVNGRDGVGLTFNVDEIEYICDVENLMAKIFGLNNPRRRKLPKRGLELIFYSKIAQEFFANFCYGSKEHSAATKSLTLWMLGLAPELQVEILKGWWRGDKGYTSSRLLMNQMKILLLRLGIIPSIYKESREKHLSRGGHNLGAREIKANHDCYAITNLSFFEDKFNLLTLPEFGKFKNKGCVKHGWIDKKYTYLPIRDIEISEYEGDVYNLEVETDNSYVTEFATVHNCWTPWFSLFGSMSGFDSIDEAFEELTDKIYAVETGLSSDPPMNWRLSQLDRFQIVSFSDAHSPQPHRSGREATVFELEEPNYFKLLQALKNPDEKNKIKLTIEFYPEEGKYHFDGHRLCNVCFSPEESKRNNFLCPVCGRRVTVGVMSRVEELADRPANFTPSQRPPYKNFVPLTEILAKLLRSQPTTQKVLSLYSKLIEAAGSEINLLLTDISLTNCGLPTDIIEGVEKAKAGHLFIKPGFDGEYGVVELQAEKKLPAKSLF